MNHEDIVKMGKKRNPMNHVTVCIKKEALVNSGGYQSLLYLEDYYLWLRMIVNNCKLENLNETLVLVRVGNGFEGRRSTKKYIEGWKTLQNFMKKNIIILFSFILLIVILAVFITLEIINMNNKDKFKESTISLNSINKEKKTKQKELEDQEKVKIEEQEKLWEKGEELYMTINNKTITCSKNVQYLSIDENSSKDYKNSYFNQLWNELKTEILEFDLNENVLANLQISRLGYPSDDLNFTILETVSFRENGTYEIMYSSPFYYKNENKNKMISINTANKGKSILGYKILITDENNTFEKYYLYKIDVQ